MNVFEGIYYFTIFSVPILVYIIFKKSSPPSRYSKPVWYHFLKKWVAKRAIYRFQEKHKLALNTASAQKLEHPKEIREDKNSDTHVIYGADIHGNYITLKIILREQHHAEVSIILKLKNGDLYQLPNEPRVLLCSTVPGKWKAENLEISVLEPFIRLRITYNGLLRKTSRTSNNVEHVNFKFIWNSASKPLFYPSDMSEEALADALAREKWKDSYWIELLDVEKGYEQFGELKGVVSGSEFDSEVILNLASWRRRYYGVADAYNVYRDFSMFGIAQNGTLFNVGVRSYRRNCSHVKYGAILKSNKRLHVLDDIDINLEYMSVGCSMPHVFTVNFYVSNETYRCVFHVDTFSQVISRNDETKGWTRHIFPAECDFNIHQCKSVITSWYKSEGLGMHFPPPLLRNVKRNEWNEIFVTSLTRREARILELTGGKGNSLALLTSINTGEFLVPGGFVITVDAFRHQLNQNEKLQNALKHLEQVSIHESAGELSRVCQEVVDLFSNEPIPDNIQLLIDQHVEMVKMESMNMFSKIESIKWAIRSSGISEDSEDLSAAGQNSTYLGCTALQQIRKAIAQCWGSLYSFQSVQYRKQHGLSVLADMAVVVQAMVASDVAGVLFTCHPTTGNPAEMVITSNYGLGESVVSGQADPDTIILSRDWLGEVAVKSEIIGAKKSKVTMFDVDENEIDGTNTEQVPDEASKTLSLNMDQAIQLGKVGILLEKLFGNPRDIEWAFCQGKLYLLQARPITTLNTWTDFELEHEFDTPCFTDQSIYTKANIGEVFPGALTVLSQTLVSQSIEQAMQTSAQGDYSRFCSKLLTTFSHQCFLDMLNGIYVKPQKSITLNERVLDIAILGHIFFDENIHKMAVDRNGLVSSLGGLKELMDGLRLGWNNKRNMKRAIKLNNTHSLTVNDGDTPKQIVEKIENFLPIMRHIMLLHCHTTRVSVLYQFIAMFVLAGNSEELNDDHFHDISFLLSNCDGVVSAEVPVILSEVAQRIIAQGVSEEFASLKPNECQKFLEDKVPDANKILNDFFVNYGHRSIKEFELSTKTWGMDKNQIIEMVQANVKNKTFTKKSKVLSCDETIAKMITPKYKSTKVMLKWLINKCRVAVKFREETKSEAIKSIHRIRIAFRQLAEKLVSDGYISDENLLFHFTITELKEFIAKRTSTLLSKAVRRQKLYPRWDSTQYPEMNFSTPVPDSGETIEFDTSSLEGDNTLKLKGTPVYAGNVLARCCVVPDLSHIDELQSGDILITHSTDIGWSPYFPILSGIITELGGLISHGAVVAREYGLPSIVGVKDATKYFRTGDIVLLNGKSGDLQLINRE